MSIGNEHRLELRWCSVNAALKHMAVVSAVVVIAVPYVKVLADDTVITLDETAKKFVVIDKNLAAG